MIPEAPAVAAPVEAPAAPPTAPPAPPVQEPISAVDKAVLDKDQDAYHKARHEERFGTPKETPAPPAKPVEKPATEPPAPEKPPVTEPPAAEQPTRTLSKRQQEANEATRRAVELATTDLRRELAALRAQLQPPAKPTAVPEADPEPDPTNVETYPNGQFDIKFVKDLASWQTRQDLKVHSERSALASRQNAEVAAFAERATKSRELVQAAVKADPAILDDIDPALATLKPTLALAPGEGVTFGNLVADWLCSTDYPVELMKHLSNRAEQDRLSNLSDAAFLREQGRIEASFAKPAPASSASAPPAKVITEAPDPADTLGTRPIDQPDALDSAIRAHDQTAYSAAKKAKGLLHYSA